MKDQLLPMAMSRIGMRQDLALMTTVHLQRSARLQQVFALKASGAALDQWSRWCPDGFLKPTGFYARLCFFVSWRTDLGRYP